MAIKLEPLEYRVVVLPDEIDDTIGGGILVKAEHTKAQDKRMQTKGTVVAVSDVAFADWKGKAPGIGDRVLFAMYAGQFHMEGETEYRIMNDNEIIGLLKE